ncbi:hypothetical protein GCM10023147_41740 [Tsukamurella soli]|uniref:Mobilisation protein (MobC) n=1 Tax=Tsukamurella soli TaxID=644556 RepID=A0ABP8K7X6_9ACTN
MTATPVPERGKSWGALAARSLPVGVETMRESIPPRARLAENINQLAECISRSRFDGRKVRAQPYHIAMEKVR